MHLYSFDDSRLGAGDGNGTLVDITSVVDAGVAPEQRMRALIEDWDNAAAKVKKLIDKGQAIALDGVTVRAPVSRPQTVVAAPVNYKRHQEEMGGSAGVYAGETIKTIETYAGFSKASGSVIGPDEPILLPWPDRRFDHEAEIGVVMGRRAHKVTREEAMDYVFGLVPLLDITMRGEEDRSFRKSFDTFTPIGPAIVTLDEIADHSDIAFDLTVNGKPRQKANSRDLIYDIPRLIELYSEVMTLEPGDLIASGTPEGVGEIKPGDSIVLTLEGIGRLEMAVAAS